MLKKECRDILIQSFFFAVAMVALPAIIFLTRIIPKQPYAAIFIPTFQSGMLFWALFMGVSLFSSERGQKGMEYLLSLPYSRLKLLAIKVLPRFLSILFFYVVFLILYYQGGRDFVALALFSLSFLYFVLFFISLSLSALSDNFLVISLVSLFALVVFNEVFFLIPWLIMRREGITEYSWSEISSTFLQLEWTAESWLSFPVLILAALFLLIPLGLAMLASFKKFDVRPSKIYGRRYFKFLVPSLVLGILGAALTISIGIDRGPKEFYLTRDQKLIETTYLYAKIYDQNKVAKLKVHFFPYYCWDDPPYLYYFDWGNGLVRLNTATVTTEMIYQEPKLARKHYWGFSSRFKFGNTIVLFEPRRLPDEIQLVLIDTATKNVTRIPFKHDFFRDSDAPHILDSTVRERKTSWLVFFSNSTKHPLRLWEDGHVDNLEYKDKILDKSSAHYVNGMLFLTNNDGLTIFKEDHNVFVAVKNFPKEDRPWYWMWTWGLFPENEGSVRIKEFYGKRKDRLVRIDLETLDIEDMGEWKKIEDGFFIGLYFKMPYEFYYSENNGREQTIKIFKLEGNQKILLKTFENFDGQQRINGFEISKGGLVIQRGKKVQVYSLPDLKEIQYKGLPK
jgi:ABC-type transport system involved in multi-copper enzyme maturation permease subunit